MKSSLVRPMTKPLMNGRVVMNTDVFIDGTDVVVVKDGVEVFRRTKNEQTVLIANALYFYHKYGGKI